MRHVSKQHGNTAAILEEWRDDGVGQREDSERNHVLGRGMWDEGSLCEGTATLQCRPSEGRDAFYQSGLRI